MSTSITALDSADLAQLQALLASNDLPTDDVADIASSFVAIYEAGQLVAAGGLEPAGRYGLLRSVVVDPGHRGQGLAARITEFLIASAARQRMLAVYLLTETAAEYFAGRGFTRVERTGVPAEIAVTRQFASLCPDSAICMHMPLSAHA